MPEKRASLDLQREDGRQILRALVRQADGVIVTQPGACEPDWFLEANPRIAVVAVDDVEQ